MKNNEQISIGDYVLATKWADADPRDQWAIGHVSDISNNRYYVVDGQGILFRANGFREVRKITEKQGEDILEHKNYIQTKSDSSLWDWLKYFDRMRDIDEIQTRAFKKPKTALAIAGYLEHLHDHCPLDVQNGVRSVQDWLLEESEELRKEATNG